MKYLLICHGESEPVTVVICDTEEQRLGATMIAILGNKDELQKVPEREWEGYVTELKETGRLTFEGDPPLEWLNVLELQEIGKLSGYDAIKKEIEDLPMTWIPALLKIMVHTALKKKVFVDGGVLTFVDKVIKG